MDQQILEVQSHCPFTEASFKARTKLCMHYPIRTNTKENRTKDLEHSEFRAYANMGEMDRQRFLVCSCRLC